VHRGAIAEISLSAIAHNLQIIKEIVRNLPVIAVVKADAYGHGAVEVSKRLIKEGVSFLGVAYTSEAIELREANLNTPIIVFFDNGNIKDFFDYHLIPVIYNEQMALSISNEALKRGKKIKVHVKVDTGMGRLGLIGNETVKTLFKIAETPGIELVGILSHFSEADLSDRSYAHLQLDRFIGIRDEISKILKRNIFSHIANSAAVITYKDAHLDAVRPGLMLYGYSPLIKNPPNLPLDKEGWGESLNYLVPAMMVKTRILCIRDIPAGIPISYGRTFITKRPGKIGVLPIGYADGYSRLFSNNADVIVKGKRVPVVGKVCMDLTMVDLTDIKDSNENDEVIILGRRGNELINAQELAYRSNTIPYETLTSLGNRSKRIYVESH
jgi:alanine racemase